MHYALLESSFLPENQDIVCCFHCGAVYADTSGTQADYDHSYANSSSYGNARGIGSGIDKDDADRLNEIALWLKKRIPTENTRVADISCGNGGLLIRLSRYRFSSLTGIDPSTDCVERLKAAEFFAHQGHLGKLPENCVTYGLIIISHVLEHVANIANALSAVKEIISKNGKIYIDVPDASSYIDNTKNTSPFQYFNLEYVNHFDPSILMVIASINSLVIDDVVEKEFPFSNYREYGVDVILSRHKQGSSHSFHGKNKNALREKILTYARLPQHEQGSFWFNLAKEHRPILLWGAGLQAQRQLENPILKQLNIVVVVDRDPNKQGKLFAGCMISPPEEGLHHLPENTLIIISAVFFAEAIKKELAKINADLPYFIS
jgi:2-polyprenyl-3-methyl-5-hydroxy-6-metoxy-1,4-benzoquinol methylase